MFYSVLFAIHIVTPDSYPNVTPVIDFQPVHQFTFLSGQCSSSTNYFLLATTCLKQGAWPGPA